MEKKQIVAISIIILMTAILFYSIGYAHGFAECIDWSLGKVKYFVELDFNKTEISKAIMEYKRYIDIRYPNGKG